MPKFISVIIIAHDRKAYIVSATQSVLNQNYRREDYEIIVVKSFHDKDIDDYLERNGIYSIYTDAVPIGSKAVLGIRMAKGEIICFLEDDDLFSADKLQKVQDIFNSSSEIGYCHNSFDAVEENGSNTKPPFFMRIPKKSAVLDLSISTKAGMREVFKYGLHFNTSSISILREVVDSSYLEGKTILDLTLFYLTVSKGYKISYVPERLTKYMVHVSDSKTTGLSFGEFVERKSIFYTKLSTTLLQTLILIGSHPIRRFTLCDKNEQDLILSVLMGDLNRREKIRRSLRCLRCAPMYRSSKFRYAIELTSLGLFSAVLNPLAKYILFILSKV